MKDMETSIGLSTHLSEQLMIKIDISAEEQLITIGPIIMAHLSILFIRLH
jgi:hypothetical protein